MDNEAEIAALERRIEEWLAAGGKAELAACAERSRAAIEFIEGECWIDPETQRKQCAPIPKTRR